MRAYRAPHNVASYSCRSPSLSTIVVVVVVVVVVVCGGGGGGGYRLAFSTVFLYLSLLLFFSQSMLSF